MLVPIQVCTNMAAGNQQKHVTEFWYESINLSLEELKNIYSATFFNARTVQMAKFPEVSLGISHFLTSSAVM